MRVHIRRGLSALPFALIAALSAKTVSPDWPQLAMVVAAVLVAAVAAVGVSRLRRLPGTWSHWLIGGVLALAPLGGWLAVRRPLSVDPVVLAAAFLFWLAGFDIISSCPNAVADRDSRVFTLPARWGIGNALLVSAGSHVAACWLLAVFGQLCNLGWVFLLGVVAVVPGLYLAHRLLRPEDVSRARITGYPTAIILGCLLLGFGVADVWWRARLFPI
ncbi:MAG: UbiA family prenyltransferase [Armatimonadetes bacterium]|nr:UbiA family prenyltransferase [Armatimonadota bacterium]